MRPGGIAALVPGILLMPKKLVTPEFSELLGLRWVSLAMLALSVMLTCTVRMSPI